MTTVTCAYERVCFGGYWLGLSVLPIGSFPDCIQIHYQFCPMNARADGGPCLPGSLRNCSTVHKFLCRDHHNNYNCGRSCCGTVPACASNFGILVSLCRHESRSLGGYFPC
jgi:hypothetical protein